MRAYYKKGGGVKSPAWTRKEGKRENGGLNAAGRKSYKKGTLKKPVPRGPRHVSFCKRMKGMKEKLTEARSTTGLTRSDLRAALDVTDPRTELMATDEVVPAIATLLNCKVFIHEEGSVIEVEDYDAVAENELHIGYEPGHFYGLKKE